MKEEHKEKAEKGCYYHATTNSTSGPSSASRARNCSLGCSVVRAVYVGAVPVTTSWATDSKVQKAPRPAGDERGGCRSHPPHDERSANLPRERVRVLIRSLPLARGGLPLFTKHKTPLGPAKVPLCAAHPRTPPLCPHPFAPSSWLWSSLGLCSGSSS
jgi:hypothetical protein